MQCDWPTNQPNNQPTTLQSDQPITYQASKQATNQPINQPTNITFPKANSYNTRDPEPLIVEAWRFTKFNQFVVLKS